MVFGLNRVGRLGEANWTFLDMVKDGLTPAQFTAIKEIEKSAVFVQVLGCYAADTTGYNLQ